MALVVIKPVGLYIQSKHKVYTTNCRLFVEQIKMYTAVYG